MNILYILIPLSLAMAACGLLACIWAIKTGQYQDTRGPAELLVFDEASVCDFDDISAGNRNKDSNS